MLASALLGAVPQKGPLRGDECSLVARALLYPGNGLGQIGQPAVCEMSTISREALLRGWRAIEPMTRPALKTARGAAI